MIKMTKTETQIAQENVKYLKLEREQNRLPYYKPKSEEHKATCQRFLEFLEELRDEIRGVASDEGLLLSLVNEKITDLKQAIKLYEDAGI